ncbi:MAG TPA: DUF1080 domain-containing protein [Bryobacteraceae bacterium]|jgi:hypothetical protein|nr:DUF1080 domain-containing protein [Bryobacteraceae bacterium]
MNGSPKWTAAAVLILVGAAAGVTCGQSAKEKYRKSPVGYSDTPVLPGQKWKVHDIDRPRPAVVTPGAAPGQPPSDAIVLFDGKDLSKWTTQPKKNKSSKGGASGWKLGNGYVEVAGGAGDLVTREKFGDIQLHVEWASPTEITGDSQWRGNSGILIMSRYEIQVLDSYNNKTYADGQAAAVYGQWPPLVNASRKPGEWQTYDIIFEAPKFQAGKVARPAYVTVIHNGVVAQHHQEIIAPMAHRIVKPYEPHGAEEPLALQDHDTPVRYRNIWVRRMKGRD